MAILEIEKIEKSDNIKFKIGDKVKWIGSGYTIESINKKGAILRQRFSIGVLLKEPVSLSELSLDEV